MRTHFFRNSLLPLALFALGACTDDTTAPTPIGTTTLSINPVTRTLYEADAVVLTAVLRDANGIVIPDAPVVWSISDTLRAQLGGNGYVLALRNGVVKVSASSNGANATYDLTITRAPVQNIAVLLQATTITRGDVAVVGVRVDGPDGRILTGRAVSITSDNPSVATVDASGRVRGVSVGVANIRASAEGVVGTAQIRISSENTVFNLSKYDGHSIPILLSADSVMYEGLREYHEVYLESGIFMLSGSPVRYDVLMRIAQYNVTKVNGQRTLQLRYSLSERDRGLVTYDARGDLQLTSEYTYPLNHSVSPISGGMQMRYRIAGSDEVMNLFFRREPN